MSLGIIGYKIIHKLKAGIAEKERIDSKYHVEAHALDALVAEIADDGGGFHMGSRLQSHRPYRIDS